MRLFRSRRLAISLPLVVSLILPSSHAAIVYVNKNATGTVHDGKSWSTAFTTVQVGVDATANGDEVWVAVSSPAAPAYVENVKISTGAAVFGGFVGTETERGQRDWRRNVTVLDGNNAGSVVWASANGSGVDGFTIRNGGLGVYATGNPCTVANNSISGNSVGIYSDGTSVITGNRISRNYALDYCGGGICEPYGSAIIANNIIDGNETSSTGGGIYVGSATATIVNNTISGNYADVDGGAVYVYGTARCSNNIIAFNGSGVYGLPSLGLPFKDNDVFGNEQYNFTHSIDPTGSNGNVSTDPLLSGIYNNAHLEPTSPCVDAGDDSSVVGSTDVYGKPRIIGQHVDLGADESDGTIWAVIPAVPRVIRVSPVGDDTDDGSSWSTAIRSVRAALSIAVSGDEVWVAKGVYLETITLHTGISVFGGFAGTESARSERNWKANSTTLDAKKAGRVVTIAGNGAVLDGFTVQNGLTAGSWQVGGAGVCIWTGTRGAIVQNNVITGNTLNMTVNADIGGVYGWGGGIFVGGPDAIIERNSIRNNTAIGHSYITWPCPCVNWPCSPYCSYPAGNASGGGIYATGATGCRIRDNVLLDNTASGNQSSDGGGIAAGNDAIVSNNTLVGNGAGSGGGMSTSGTVLLADNLIVGNSSGISGPQTGITVSHCNVFGNTGPGYSGLPDPAGTAGNLSVDAHFTNPSTGDYHLSDISPCIDAGDDSVVAAGETDLDGNPRITGAHVDIGAYEAPPPMRAFVSAGVHGTVHNGRSWNTAFPSLKEGLDAVLPGGEVWVAKGTYRGNGQQVKPFVSLLGGFSGTEITAPQRDPKTNVTTVDGNADADGHASAPILTIAGGGVTIDGFALRNGSEFAASASSAVPGAAIRYEDHAGASDSFTISHNEIRDCFGSAIYCGPGSVPTIVCNRISNNSRGSEGGGIRLNGAAANIRDNLLDGNTVTSQAGGIRVYASSATIVNNTIVNSQGASGIGIASFGQPVLCANNVIAFNGGGVGVEPGTDLSAVTWRFNNVFGNASWNYSTLTDQTGSNGNISVDPQFISRAASDFHLFEGSFCINTGSNSYFRSDETDLDGGQRRQGVRVDIGAYEFPTPTIVTIGDVVAVLHAAGGIWAGTPDSMSRLNPDRNGSVDLLDAVRLARQVAGLER